MLFTPLWLSGHGPPPLFHKEQPMKKLIALALSAAVGFVFTIVALGVVLHVQPARAGAPTGALGTGDVNGDGVVDVSDAVFTLIYLFKGGPAPVACADSPEIVSRIVALETALFERHDLTPEQAEILSHFSLVELPIDDQGTTARTIRITSANLQIVNGMGATNGHADQPFTLCLPPSACLATNALGNLIVGYQELRPNELTARTGSHNVILGQGQNYSGVGGFVAGRFNTISDFYTSVSGGFKNTASGFHSSVGGGERNVAEGQETSVIGGNLNRASGTYSSVVGGAQNLSSGDTSSVLGGNGNEAAGFLSCASGGVQNRATGRFSCVGGGEYNTSSGDRSSINGGEGNEVAGYAATVNGGRLNAATARSATVSGGQNNIARGDFSSVIGGQNNSATGSRSSVSGGLTNEAIGDFSSVTGGENNTARGRSSTIGGGRARSVEGDDNWRAGELFQEQ